MPEFFPYAVDMRLALFWLPFGFRPGKDGVTLTDDGTFRATFGFLRVETPLANIDEATSPATTGGGRPRAREARSSTAA